MPEAIPLGDPLPFHIGQLPIRPDFRDHPINVLFPRSRQSSHHPRVIIASGREIHDQPGHQVLDDGIGGMGFGELLQVMGVFELQHGFFSGQKKPAEAGSEGIGGIFIKNF